MEEVKEAVPLDVVFEVTMERTKTTTHDVFIFPRRAVIPVLVIGVGLASVVLLGLRIIGSRRSRYWSSQGSYDTYRMPLEYPYELFMIDEIRAAEIRTWPGSGDMEWIGIRDICWVCKKENLLLGLTSHETGEGYIWFVFDCASGKIEKFSTQDEYLRRVAELGFTEEPKLIPLPEFWDSFWADPGNWKGKRVPSRR